MFYISFIHLQQSKLKEKMFGYEALKKRGILDIRSPMDAGVTVDWDAMEALWEHVLREELGWPEDRGGTVLLTEYAGQPKAQREKSTQVRDSYR